MGSNRVHQLSNGLYVSGTPDKYKDRTPSMTSSAMPYTGGDIKKSGELGKMFDIPVEGPKSKKSGPIAGGVARPGSFRSASSNSGPLSGPNHNVPPQRSSYSNSGPQGAVIPGPQTGHNAGGAGFRQSSHSGPLSRNGDPASAKGTPGKGVPAGTNLKHSGPLSGGGTPGMVRQNSGPLTPNLPATGLITSGPISSAPPPGSRKFSGPLEGHSHPVNGTATAPAIGNHAITILNHDQSSSFRRPFPRIILWTVVPLFVIGFVAGGFILGAVQNAVLLIIVICLFAAVLMLLTWNTCIGKGAVTGFITNYPDLGLSQAKDGQYVKITGVVTCGGVPLETSFQRVSRCVYTSSGLYEYRGFKAKPAGQKHRTFTWGLRYLERRAVDFYISDLQSGLRALVKAGYGATITPYVEESVIVDVTRKDRELPSNFVRWLADRNLSSDDRVMRLKEGYIREGNTVTVMGVVQRNENVVMIVPPPEPVSTGCQWGRCLLPAIMDGIVLKCEDNGKADVIPV